MNAIYKDSTRLLIGRRQNECTYVSSIFMAREKNESSFHRNVHFLTHILGAYRIRIMLWPVLIIRHVFFVLKSIRHIEIPFAFIESGCLNYGSFTAVWQLQYFKDAVYHQSQSNQIINTHFFFTTSVY